MITGWYGDEHLFLFEDQSEAIEMTRRYGVHDRIPAHTLIGLRGWDDFILMSSDQRPKIVPTVPLTADELADWQMPNDLSALEPDPKTDGKIKWYVTPLIFGGSPTDVENTAWVTIDQHVDLVRWWNTKYDEIRSQQAEQGIAPNAR
jgi:hypothetical protein